MAERAIGFDGSWMDLHAAVDVFRQAVAAIPLDHRSD